MEIRTVKNLRNVPEISLAALFGAGIVGSITFSYMMVTQTNVIGDVLPERLIEVFLLGLPAAGLLYAGFWLATGEFTPAEIWGIGSYAIAGVVVAGVIVSLSLLTTSLSGLRLREIFLLYVGTGTEGAFIGMLGGVVHMTDLLHQGVTDQEQKQAELIQENERLETFAGIVSHDLRNPLNVAQGRLELAREECNSDNFEAIERAHDRMEALIENLLMVARHGESVTDPEEVSLDEMVTTCWGNVQTGNATLLTDIHGTIQADRSRFKQLLENLFRNAIEHGGEGVTVRVGELNNGFYIEDDGSGIPKDDRDDVFTAGYSTSHEGTGFGLNIVKAVVEAHGWQIHVTEGPQDGARFEITCREIETE